MNKAQISWDLGMASTFRRKQESQEIILLTNSLTFSNVCLIIIQVVSSFFFFCFKLQFFKEDPGNSFAILWDVSRDIFIIIIVITEDKGIYQIHYFLLAAW